MSIQKMEHILILAKDIEITKKFYETILDLNNGYRPPFSFPGYWMYLGATAVIHLVQAEENAVAEGENLQLLLSDLNKTVGNLPSVMIEDMKTRIHILDYFCVASGNSEGGYFIHARVIQTKPRSLENQKLLSQTVQSTLEKFFLKKKNIRPLQICVETTIIPDGGYLKSIHASV